MNPLSAHDRPDAFAALRDDLVEANLFGANLFEADLPAAGFTTADQPDAWLLPGALDRLGKQPGAYLLALRLDVRAPLDIKRLRVRALQPGVYLYTGSARGGGGIAARLKRHFRQDKKIHWHIDRLTVRAAALTALAVPHGNECTLAQKLLGSGRFESAAAGFGSSDCRTCDSHLLTPIASARTL